MPNNMIAMMIFIPLLIFFSMFIIDSVLPYYVLMNLNSVCDEYRDIVVADGKVTTSETSELRSKLEARGLKNIVMNLPTDKEWGSSYLIDISGSFTINIITINIKKSTKSYDFSYKKRGSALRGGD